jgi:hypothetical protein
MGLKHLNEHEEETFRTLSLTFMIYDFRVIGRQWESSYNNKIT